GVHAPDRSPPHRDPGPPLWGSDHAVWPRCCCRRVRWVRVGSLGQRSRGLAAVLLPQSSVGSSRGGRRGMAGGAGSLDSMSPLEALAGGNGQAASLPIITITDAALGKLLELRAEESD